MRWWNLVSLCQAGKLRGSRDVLALVAKRAAGCHTLVLLSPRWINPGVSCNSLGSIQVLVVSHLDASSMLHLASSSTQMATLISAPIEWQNLLKKFQLDRLGAQICIGQICSLRIWHWKQKMLSYHFNVKVWPSWPTSWKLSTTQLCFSLQFSTPSVNKIHLMMGRPEGRV